ncbi:DUF4268 domain-containing protein [Haliea sp. AH-315-K21]|uniref:DUF4268 domain-containing protein n=1 Tax=SAR86 cluster bacterium TaxID=2030880 RepID=A0A2A5CHG7_9GAMM|nr:DUF4268 domain-containing protein [Haliea sp. AH-315-K21]MBN4075652.1 DUF4268 domain-containing protein [Gammaproteobacteria bacterium AH-315-E17]PCJ42890.1 MAG: hypothetical protein COA71_05185 [SAR86 cluster bacterium]
MYKIDKSSNRISQLEVKRFSDLGFTERNHLQEWLANEPDALGEELLIIQKEFNGFDDTRERLDLLALDKDGNLVVIENKLDDTGRDVVWQALKYASYCSNLTKSQILDIYQAYLHRHSDGASAQEMICEFLELPDIEEVVLNSGSRQRIIFVAAQFRKEVTSTALWLISNGIQLQCFKVTPFQMDDQLFLNVEQIIPTPEAKELMIGISAKQAEEKNTEVELKNRHKLRRAFWEMALEAFRDSDCELYENISPSKDHWLSAGSGLSACPFNLIFSKKEARVEFSMQRSEAVKNKYIYDALYQKKAEIEQVFGARLEWLRLDNKKASRIQFAKEFDGYNKDHWPVIINWMIQKMPELEKALRPYFNEINQGLKKLN